MSKAAHYRDARIFTAGAACGFLAGAFVVAVILWEFGGLTGLRPATTGQPTDSVVVSPNPLPDAGGKPGAARPGAGMGPTLGRDRPAPTGSEAPTTIGPTPGSAAELSGRRLEVPVEGIGRSELTRQFNDRRGEEREHEALDILAPRNTPVKAVEAGRVAKLFLSKAGGITVYQFDPSERFCYYYAHLERYADGLKEGDLLQRGQVLGFVGTSGNAPKDTPHLHFAVFQLDDQKRWWEGTPLDPYVILR
ncbi:MAG: M23 family metallopeptidase [Vicinamibacterales bacterium]